MASPERGGRRSTQWTMRAGLVANVLFVLAVAVVLVLMIPGTGNTAVSVATAGLSSGSLRIEGTALPNRTITVDGVAMGTSGGDGRFQVERWGFVAPGDCTVEVNDGSARPASVRLAGCTVTVRPVARLR
jgi:hypothetical protein